MELGREFKLLFQRTSESLDFYKKLLIRYCRKGARSSIGCIPNVGSEKPPKSRRAARVDPWSGFFPRKAEIVLSLHFGFPFSCLDRKPKTRHEAFHYLRLECYDRLHQHIFNNLLQQPHTSYRTNTHNTTTSPPLSPPAPHLPYPPKCISIFISLGFALFTWAAQPMSTQANRRAFIPTSTTTSISILNSDANTRKGLDGSKGLE